MLYFTPGPSQLYPTVAKHIATALSENIGAISHRSSKYKEIHRGTVENLKALMEVPEDFEVLFFASATEIWERLIQNCVKDESIHFVNGAFSSRFHSIALELQKNGISKEAEWGQGFTFEAHNIHRQPDMLNFTHNESSTGVMQPLTIVDEYAHAFPDSLITLDIVSSAPFAQVNWQTTDAAYFSVQKGFGLPAGLGVLIASPRIFACALELEAAGISTGSYHRFTEMQKKAAQSQTPETPNVWNIFLLGKVIEDMLTIGIDNIRNETLEKAAMLESAVAKHPGLSFYVKAPEFRSPTVLVIDTDVPSSHYINALKSNGFVVGDGYAHNKGKQIRIANFPTHRITDMEKLAALISGE